MNKRRWRNSWRGSRAVSEFRGPAPVINELAIQKLLGSVVVASSLRDAETFLPGLPSRQFETAASVAARIDAVIADDDMYESGEPRPSEESVNKAKALIVSAERDGSRFPRAKISVYFGEIDLTWTVQNRLLRLIVRSDPDLPALLYLQSDKGEALTRGESAEVGSAEELSQKFEWLLG
jgi:hypothetical protein